MDLHETLDQILTHPTPELSPVEIAFILGVSRQSVTEAIRLDRMEGVKMTFREHGARERYRVTKSALVKWLWDHTTGDKSTLRAALAMKAPGLLAVLEQPQNLVRFPAGQTHKSTTPNLNSNRATPPRHVHTTANTSRRFDGHPDLFDELFAAEAATGGAAVSGEGATGGAADQSRCG
jgi:hypothetical protein